MNCVKLLVIAAALPLLASCADSSSAAVVAPEMASFARSAPLPFNGRCDTKITFAMSQAGDPSNSQRLHITYVCQLPHLGRTTAVADQILIFTGPATVLARNATVYTAANGDELHSTWSGVGDTGVDGTVEFSGPEIYAGGTGRFINASGSSFISGSASLTGAPPFAGQFTLAGTLRY